MLSTPKESEQMDQLQEPGRWQELRSRVLILHCILLVITLLVWGFLIPVYGEKMFDGARGSLPGPTEFVLSLSDWVTTYPIMSIALACTFLVGDRILYVWLGTKNGRNLDFRWYWGMSIFLAFLILFSICTMYLPIFCGRRL